MRLHTKHAVGLGALMLTALVGFGPTAGAQSQPAYYYPSAGWYATTGGPLYIPVPGHYYNVPASVGVPSYAVAPPSWNPPYPYAPRRFSRGPRYNSPSFYSGAQHSLHGRGFDSGQHGR